MPVFGTRSKSLLALCHPKLIAVANAAITHIDFSLTQTVRGRAAQEAAVKAGNSRAHFGHSAHNFTPALALDMLPYPFDGNWNAPDLVPRMKAVADVFYAEGERLGVPIIWGGCGKDGWETIIDNPHIELADWHALSRSLPFAE